MYKGSFDEQDLISAGSIVFDAGDDLTVEKKTANILLSDIFSEIPEKCLLAIEKPTEDTAGDLTVYTYNVIAIDNEMKEMLSIPRMWWKKSREMRLTETFSLRDYLEGREKLKSE